jgi:hypothetical protein
MFMNRSVSMAFNNPLHEESLSAEETASTMAFSKIVSISNSKLEFCPLVLLLILGIADAPSARASGFARPCTFGRVPRYWRSELVTLGDVAI